MLVATAQAAMTPTFQAWFLTTLVAAARSRISHIDCGNPNEKRGM